MTETFNRLASVNRIIALKRRILDVIDVPQGLTRDEVETALTELLVAWRRAKEDSQT